MNESACGVQPEDLKARVDALYLEYIFPVLATVRLGEDPGAVAWEAGLLDAARAVGIRVRRYILPEDLNGAELAGLIRQIDAEPLLSALLLLRPLPDALAGREPDFELAPGKALRAAPWTELLSRVADAAERQAAAPQRCQATGKDAL